MSTKEPEIVHKTDSSNAVIIVKDMSMSYDGQIIQKNLNFSINQNDIFVIMGNSGSGKSTLMKAMTGLNRPDSGDVYFSCDFYARHNNNVDLRTVEKNYRGFWQSDETVRHKMMSQFGVMFQNGALFSSMTLLENVSLRLIETTRFSSERIRKIAALKLALVGLKGFEHYYPSEISGGMQKRVSIARAMAMDPPILFFDEPSAGLDPVSSKQLDDLLLELRDSMGVTMVVVTHELDSIFSIANNSIFLDHEQKTIIASGDPKKLVTECDNEQVRAFLSRGKNI